MNCRSSLWSEPGGALHGACGGAGIPASFPEMAPARQHQRLRGDRAKEKKERREKLFFFIFLRCTVSLECTIGKILLWSVSTMAMVQHLLPNVTFLLTLWLPL
ncbi:unnamed protein product [Urochloa humidicola]